MTILIKAAALGITGALTALLIRRSAPELALALGIAVSLVAAGLATDLVGDIREVVELARTQMDLSPAIVSPVMKCVGIGIVTKLSADLCKDGGQGAIASAVELCGVVCALSATLPLIRALLQMIGEFL